MKGAAFSYSSSFEAYWHINPQQVRGSEAAFDPLFGAAAAVPEKNTLLHVIPVITHLLRGYGQT